MCALCGGLCTDDEEGGECVIVWQRVGENFSVKYILSLREPLVYVNITKLRFYSIDK